MNPTIETPDHSSPSLLPHLSHSRLQKYITCPEQYRLYYLEGLRPKQEAAARVFGAVMHLALAEYFRKQRDPVATFRAEWAACRQFDLRYAKRESWEKLSEMGEALLKKFLAQEAQKFEQILAVEAQFNIGVSSVAALLVGTLDLLAVVQGKKTLVEFKTGVNDWWHFTERTPEQQVEYLRKMEIVAQQITDRVFYKRVGFWCRQCDFLPICAGNEKKARETLVRIT